MKLPDTDGLTVAYDTESSGLHTDDGHRISIVSCAWRDPDSAGLQSFAVPFDQGVSGTWQAADRLDRRPLRRHPTGPRPTGATFTAG